MARVQHKTNTIQGRFGLVQHLSYPALGNLETSDFWKRCELELVEKECNINNQNSWKKNACNIIMIYSLSQHLRKNSV